MLPLGGVLTVQKILPFCSNISMISVCPLWAARARGVNPQELCGSGCAPETNISFTMSCLPSLAASWRAVLSLVQRRFTSAPQLMSKAAISQELCRTAGKLEVKQASCSPGNYGQSILLAQCCSGFVRNSSHLLPYASTSCLGNRL